MTNTAGYHPGLVTPFITDGAKLLIIKCGFDWEVLAIFKQHLCSSEHWVRKCEKRVNGVWLIIIIQKPQSRLWLLITAALRRLINKSTAEKQKEAVRRTTLHF